VFSVLSVVHYFSCISSFNLVKFNPVIHFMESTVTSRGQTVIPAAIRRRYTIEAGDRLVWLDDGMTIKVIPVPGDPVSGLRGHGKGKKLVEALLAQRRQERLDG
jgi:AbrB family looped-hinge helix DNA binding protein